MRKITPILLTFALLLVTNAASGWNSHSYATIMSLTAKHLTAETAQATKQALGEELSSLNISKSGKSILHLNKDYAPTTNGENDALTAAEQCIERLKKNGKDREAILLLAKAIADMHAVPNIDIEGNERSVKDFKVRRWNNRKGRLARYTPTTWHALWNSYYSGRKAIFTPQLYAEDVNMFYGRSQGGYSQGGPAEWAADIGRECRAIYARGIGENHAMRQEEVNELEFTHDRLLAKAAYRLATLLNSLVK